MYNVSVLPVCILIRLYITVQPEQVPCGSSVGLMSWYWSCGLKDCLSGLCVYCRLWLFICFFIKCHESILIHYMLLLNLAQPLSQGTWGISQCDMLFMSASLGDWFDIFVFFSIPFIWQQKLWLVLKIKIIHKTDLFDLLNRSEI